MIVKLITSTEELASLESQWGKLLASVHNANIFMSYTWLFQWWLYFGEPSKLSIIAVYKKNKLIGLAPLYLESKQRIFKFDCLKFIGTNMVCSDHLDFIIHKEFEEQVTKILIDYIKKLPWDLLQLEEIPNDSLRLEIFDCLFKNILKPIYQVHSSTCPYAELPSNWDEYFMSRSSSRRADIKRKTRKLESAGKVEFEVSYTQEKMEHFIRLNKDRLTQRQLNGGFANKKLEQFHRTLFSPLHENDQIRLCLLKVNGEYIAGLYNFKLGDRWYFYLSGMDSKWAKHSPLTVLFSKTIQYAIEKEQIKIFDFLRGEEAYKESWTNRNSKSVELTIYNQTQKGLLLLSARHITEGLRVIKRFLCKSFITNLIKSIRDRRLKA